MHFTVEHPLGQHGCAPDCMTPMVWPLLHRRRTVWLRRHRVHRAPGPAKGVGGQGWPPQHGSADCTGLLRSSDPIASSF